MHEPMPIDGLDEPSISVREFATALGVHRVTVHRWVKQGLITYWRTPSGRVRIPESAVKASITVHGATHSPAQAA
jgi:excisionase family DNA binding protein